MYAPLRAILRNALSYRLVLDQILLCIVYMASSSLSGNQ